MVTPAARALLAVLCLGLASAPAAAQTDPVPPPPSAAPASVEPVDEDLVFVPAEPDFTLISLPSRLRLPDGKWGFRIAHRFTRALAEGSFGDLASDFFGFDGSALVGFELRYGLRPGTQLVFLRTSDRTIQLMAQQSIVRQGARPLAIDAIAAVQGLDNLGEDYTGTLGLLVSRRFGDRAAVYAHPLAVLNPMPELSDGDEAWFVLGLAARIRFGASTYVVVEGAPRLTSSGPDDHHMSFAIEKRRGGHTFQINFSNSFATTLGQVARAYGGSGEWHIGFNISRKFYRHATPPRPSPETGR